MTKEELEKINKTIEIVNAEEPNKEVKENKQEELIDFFMTYDEDNDKQMKALNILMIIMLVIVVFLLGFIIWFIYCLFN